VITSAALLLVIVVGAFSASGITFIKLMGVGMIVALIVDATIVRVLLVPATMRLLGRANWYAPRPLRRLYAKYGISESGTGPGESAPAAELEPRPLLVAAPANASGKDRCCSGSIDLSPLSLMEALRRRPGPGAGPSATTAGELVMNMGTPSEGDSMDSSRSAPSRLVTVPIT